MFNSKKETLKIKGTVVYQSLSGGFWGIVDQAGNQWRPVKCPKALQKEGLKVSLEAQKDNDAISIFMWGTSIQILKFKIL